MNVKEALKHMEQQPAGGAPSPARVQEVIELRRILEPEVAALAAQRRTAEDVERIRRLLARQAEAPPEDIPAQDTRFHMALAKASGNEVLWEVAAMLHDLLAETRSHALQSPDRIARSLAAHRRIVDALERGDAQACREAMRDHLAEVEGKALGIPREG